MPALQEAATVLPTLEGRRRVEALLLPLSTGSLPAEQVRLVRAVEVLERVATPEARQALQALANRAPERW